MIRQAVIASALLLPLPASGVGLGPLRTAGVTASERKGFYLTLINPYPTAERFQLIAVSEGNELPEPRIVIPLDQTLMGGGGQRRLLVVATALKPGETLNFRVCAERMAPAAKELIHARVCAKLSARRLG